MSTDFKALIDEAVWSSNSVHVCSMRAGHRPEQQFNEQMARYFKWCRRFEAIAPHLASDNFIAREFVRSAVEGEEQLLDLLVKAAQLEELCSGAAQAALDHLSREEETEEAT